MEHSSLYVNINWQIRWIPYKLIQNCPHPVTGSWVLPCHSHAPVGLSSPLRSNIIRRWLEPAKNRSSSLPTALIIKQTQSNWVDTKLESEQLSVYSYWCHNNLILILILEKTPLQLFLPLSEFGHWNSLYHWSIWWVVSLFCGFSPQVILCAIRALSKTCP